MNGKCRIEASAGWLVLATYGIFFCLLPLTVCKGIADMDTETAEMASKPSQNSKIFPDQNANQQSNINDAADKLNEGSLNARNLHVRDTETDNYDTINDSQNQHMQSYKIDSPHSAHRNNRRDELPVDRIRFDTESKSIMSQSHTGYSSPGQFNSRDTDPATTRPRTQPPLIHHADRPTKWNSRHLPAIAAAVTTTPVPRWTQPPLTHHAHRPAITKPYTSPTTTYQNANQQSNINDAADKLNEDPATTRPRTQPPLIHHADRPTKWNPHHLPAIAAAVTTTPVPRWTQPPLTHHAHRPAITKPYTSPTTTSTVPYMPTTNQPPRSSYFPTVQSPWINRDHNIKTTVKPAPTRSNTNQKQCPSKGSKPSICVPVNKCKTFIDIVEKVSPMLEFYRKYLRNLRCDYRDSVFYMCCSQDQIIRVENRIGLDSNQTIDSNLTMSHQPFNCGRIISEQNRMVKGNNAFLGEFPWMALLQYGNATAKCSGSLISQQYVLTAARCSEKHPPKSVLLGEYHKKKVNDCDERNICMPPVQKIHIKWFRAHPNYNNPRFSNDIAVIRLRKPANLLDNVIPICLPIREELQNINVERMTIAGWGVTNNERASKILQKAIIPLKSMTECQSPNMYQNKVSQICAGGKIRIDTCRGDAGAPLFSKSNYTSLPGVHSEQRYIQYGVLSYKMGKCGKGQENPNSPGTFTRVDFYMEWILDQINVL